MTDTKFCVALYYKSLAGKGGGAERMILELARGLLDIGFSVLLVTLDNSDAKSFYPISQEVKWIRLGVRSGFVGKISKIFYLYSAFRKNNISVLVGFVMSGDLTVISSCKLANVKIIAAERNGPSMYKILYSFIRRSINFMQLGLCDLIVVQFERYIYGYPLKLRSRIKVIHNPVSRVEKLAKPENPSSNGQYTLLCVSRLDNLQKQIDKLLYAFNILVDDFPDWKLKIIGDGIHKKELQKYVADKGIDNRVIFLPSTTEITPHYLTANLFVIPSAWEGFPNALAEAMACGLPSVGFINCDGVSDLICDATGWVAQNKDDVISLSNSLNAAMGDHKKRSIKGYNARIKIGNFYHENQLECWVEAIQLVG